MASKFKCGSYSIPVGVEEFRVAADIGFGATSVSLNVRSPASGTDIIIAVVVGSADESGFNVALSAPVQTGGYRLDWTAFSDGGFVPERTDTLAVGYSDLQKTVARFLGYDALALTDGQKDEIDSYIQSGVRNFYYPPKMEGIDENFEWNFLRQEGAVATEPGVDSYVLPDGFGRIAGQIRIACDATTGPRRNIVVIPYGDIMRMVNGSRAVGLPRFAATISAKEYGSAGQKKRLVLYPCPDRAYDLSFNCDADNGRLNEDDRPFPLGGAMFAELVKESCLAVAEREANDEEGVHTNAFNRILVSMIAKDRKDGAQNFGNIGVQNERFW